MAFLKVIVDRTLGISIISRSSSSKPCSLQEEKERRRKKVK
jgi:hypothetical protein